MKPALIVAGVFLLPLIFLKASDSPSITEHLETEYVVIYSLLVLASLFLTKSWLGLSPCWKVLITGTAVALLISFLAMPLATLLGLDDGWDRLANSYSLAGITGILVSSGLYALYSGVWLAGIVSYCLVWKYVRNHT